MLPRQNLLCQHQQSQVGLAASLGGRMAWDNLKEEKDLHVSRVFVRKPELSRGYQCLHDDSGHPAVLQGFFTLQINGSMSARRGP